MRQLNQEGWIHHVARYSAATFLTRGDLWLNWEDGARVSLTVFAVMLKNKIELFV